MAKTKFLIETSALPAALGESTPAHHAHYAEAVTNGVVYTSVYIRKEFIQRFIRDYIIHAFKIDHFRDLSSALIHNSQSFKSRDVKTIEHGIAQILRQKGVINNTRDMAKEFARLAIWSLHKFDRQFEKRTTNSCKCEVGAKELRVDFNDLFGDLRRFLKSLGIVENCGINEFLGLDRYGKASRLLQSDGVSETKAGKELAKLAAGKKHVTCTQCGRIGDAVIALDQPSSWCLIHIDQDFDVLCEATKRPHKRIMSERAIDADVPRID